MLEYGLMTLPLTRTLEYEFKDDDLPWYVDDGATAGELHKFLSLSIG